jgi:hypothetical protein
MSAKREERGENSEIELFGLKDRIKRQVELIFRYCLYFDTENPNNSLVLKDISNIWRYLCGWNGWNLDIFQWTRTPQMNISCHQRNGVNKNKPFRSYDQLHLPSQRCSFSHIQMDQRPIFRHIFINFINHEVSGLKLPVTSPSISCKDDDPKYIYWIRTDPIPGSSSTKWRYDQIEHDTTNRPICANSLPLIQFNHGNTVSEVNIPLFYSSSLWDDPSVSMVPAHHFIITGP